MDLIRAYMSNPKIELYNTLSRTKEEFRPIQAGLVTMYNCGPTIYDTPHIGNYRTFVTADLLRRLFLYNGYQINQTMNLTDVDDKTIRRSQEEKIGLKELTDKYERIFVKEIGDLNLIRPENLIRATEYISDMIALVEELLLKSVAYKTAEGIYLSIAKVKNYGQLAKLDLSQSVQERISNDEYGKENPRDFAVWKFTTPDDGEVSWPAPFGSGRPGWHIECSAMAMKVLGPTIDIHTGGTDLIFPHHTNEIAQSESATGKQFVHYWIHSAFMTVNGEKMAKSKGNFFTLDGLLKELVSPLSYRYWLLTSHYRSLVNFTLEAVRAAQTALIRLMQTIRTYPEGGSVSSEYQARFQALINNDLDTPKAVALAWELTKDPKVSEADKRATLIDFDRVFGLKLGSIPREEDDPIPAEVEALAEARQIARQEKDWVKSDALRKEIEARGFLIKDTDDGFRLTIS